MKSKIRCTTEKCIEAVEKYGENYHGVHVVDNPPDFMPDAIAKCERCGGFTNGTEWKHVCKICDVNVEPGKLTGLFVPHRCGDCDKKIVAEEKAKGKICRLCNEVYSRCCC